MFGSGWCGGMGIAGWLLMIGFWGGFLALVLWAVTRLFPSGRPPRMPRRCSISDWPPVRSTQRPIARSPTNWSGGVHRYRGRGPDEGGSDMTHGNLSEHGKETTMRHHLAVNISPQERLARIVVGLVGALSALFLLAGSPGTLAAVLAVLLGLAGLDLIVTGALGYCPLYARLGHVPTSLRRS